MRSFSVWGGEEVGVRIKWICGEGGKKGGKERERKGDREKGKGRRTEATGQDMWRGPATF